MRYFVAYAVYAVVVTGSLLVLVPPRPAAELRMVPRGDAVQQVHLSVIDGGDYLATDCSVKLGALAADSVMFTSVGDYQRAVELLGC